ncbi:hypothetical protein I5M27_11555 [Adhaeribacter sp. BT258]|uniref:DUF1471 domain-containing protein n=1 Tax=Adhaeribacter terrigena TaxID=2793070 RepID=A0ABS1C2K0_9BACT|nr:hypothetical protein [Adhaeribacter terrigena]MBK0403624.1 hypothetical protein [Adhaeribacter terrigena]
MKTLKKFALLGLVAPLLFSLLSFTNAVAGEGSLVAIKVYEKSGKDRIAIYADEEVTEIKLENGSDNVSRDKNLATISKTIEQYLKEGYKIQATSSADFNGHIATTYILTK